MITPTLASAVEQASKRSIEEQEVIAQLILEELDSEQKWDQLLAGSKDKLAELAKRAIAEHRAGKTIQLPEK